MMRTLIAAFASTWLFAVTAHAQAPAAPVAAPAAKAAAPAKAAVPAPTPAPKPDTATNPIIEMQTTEGTIKLELDAKAAPVSVKNFVGYVEDKFYDGLYFHRVIKDFMVQGGGYSVEGGKLKEKATKAPIINEAKNGLKNDRGTIAMARTSDPNSATAQFFINHVNNDRLNPPSFDGHGYAVFGKVIEGMDVVDKIAAMKTGVRYDMPDFPMADAKIVSAKILKPQVN